MMPFAVVLALGVFVLGVILGKALRRKPPRHPLEYYKGCLAADPLEAEGVYTVTAANIDEFSSLLPRPQAGSEDSRGGEASPPIASPSPASTARPQEQPQ